MVTDEELDVLLFITSVSSSRQPASGIASMTRAVHLSKNRFIR